LRQLLEQVDELRIDRQHILDRARRKAASDDFKPVLLRHAEVLSSQVRTQQDAHTAKGWADMDPVQFDGVINGTLCQYDRFKMDLEENAQRLEGLLESVKVPSSTLAASRFVC
jgi:programmed cell death 6-interacting protein